MNDQKMRSIDMQARRLVDEQDYGRPWSMPPDERATRLAQARAALTIKAWREEVAPLMAARLNLFSFALPVYEFSETGGQLKMVSDGLTPESRKALAALDAQIRASAEGWGLKLAAPIDEAIAAAFT